MVDPISVIRQMMAESKFNEALRQAELYLASDDRAMRSSVISIYLELLKSSGLDLKEDLLVEAAENLLESDLNLAAFYLDKISNSASSKNLIRIAKLKIKVAEKKGKLEELYGLISNLKLKLFEIKVPIRIEVVEQLVAKYFKNDFQFKLQDFALSLMTTDLQSAEIQAKDLIIACYEKATRKGVEQKLLAIAEVIGQEKNLLALYKNFCHLIANGIEHKGDYKKLVESVIYFDDFRFKLVLLELIVKLGHKEIADSYIMDIKQSTDYNYVYIEKFFSELKVYFIERPESKFVQEEVLNSKEDYGLCKRLKSLPQEDDKIEELSSDEGHIISALKFESYTPIQLMDISIALFQTGFYRATIAASRRAMGEMHENHNFLRASYIIANCYFRLKDYRAVIDLAIEALKRSESTDDVLSFQYLQAEAFLKLGEKKEAKKILKSILSIDPLYRMAKDRLEMMDEI